MLTTLSSVLSGAQVTHRSPDALSSNAAICIASDNSAGSMMPSRWRDQCRMAQRVFPQPETMTAQLTAIRPTDNQRVISSVTAAIGAGE